MGTPPVEIPFRDTIRRMGIFDMPSWKHWISGTAVFLAGSFVFTVILSLTGIREMISDRTFWILMSVAVVLGLLAWWTAAKQERDSAELRASIHKIADSANVNPNQSAQVLADEIINRMTPLTKKVEELANPPRPDDLFYQDGRVIGKVAGIRFLDESKQNFSLQALSSEREVNFGKEIEFQGVRLVCQSPHGPSAVVSFGATQTFTYANVTCRIMGSRK